MPWCDDCSRFWNPNSLAEDGSCPRCGRTVATAERTDELPAGAPWHFLLMVVALVVYLGWRAWQLVAGLF